MMLIEHKELLKHCAEENPNVFNKDKALEEAIEFCEAVVKRQTKHKTNPKKPQKEELFKEYGDFIYRGFIYLMQEFPELSMTELNIVIQDHIAHKLKSLQGYKDQGKYRGGL